ncbi:MAG: Heimdall-CTERM domain-containing surface protein, partial [Candidatus Hodarchaeota archaeon]
YKLRELESLWGIDPNLDRDVYVKLFDPTAWDWVFPPEARAYFLVEYGLALMFTHFIAEKIAPEITYPGTNVALLAQILYLTFTEFPEWFGGEIYHDPAYSAVAAVVAEGDTDTTGEETTAGGIPGFELLSVLLAIPPTYAIYRKRR